MRASATELRALLERVEAATGPDRELDNALGASMEKDRPKFKTASGQLQWDRYSASIDAAIALVELALPGWCWRVGTCHVSDDAWLCPDWNDPEHGQRLRDEFSGPVHGTIWDHGVDIDRRPPGNPALAVLEALLTALIEIEERAALPDHHQEPQANAAREG